ncbi:hypothetical protein N0754_18865 [Pseudomonas aeruginosa]|nr:hypothetical protein [Pseudomonas aeruginosa]MCS9764299.1 hypothetical protein [Pseudomonas aeruginosa]MCS9820475.1 hypothetical protein [Pseudomonas aeruginosa]MCT0241056.1 hypothetical protein [Pseudomonas aeruginosa]MCT0528509.1 hypothetical protein [Pseudomonas aeruginosa]
MNHDEEIAAIAQGFRSALEVLASQGKVPRSMNTFPAGCCGITSVLLGDYLNTRFDLQIEMVSADRGEGSHAWLDYNGTVIDLTADQFGDRPPVFLDKPDSWYGTWKVDLRGVAQHIPTATYHDECKLLANILEIAGLPSAD